ncbi:SDR family oxidoreductase [Paraburkholderia sp. MM5482-R1]|uniref:SDR family oxidoreductase n=1 Tax=unclassified Paraburkholderia TaxID=2615204 RepID=UPI003D236651
MSDEKKTALVTNAAGYAGPPAVTALSDAGFRVFVHDATFTDPVAIAQFLQVHPAAEVICADNPATLVTEAWKTAGKINAIVCNDHYPAVQISSEKASLDEFGQTLEVLVLNPFALLQAAIPLLRDQGGGNIVMITSCRTHAPIQGGAIPDAARAAANALVKSLAVELAPDAIAVNAVSPNFLYSEAYYPKAIFIDNEKGKDYVTKNVPAGRLGRPDEIGDVIRFLASTEARFLTGAIIDFNGGWPSSSVRPT